MSSHARAARVLVLDGQTNQALACVRSLGRAGHHVYVASVWRRPLAAWSRFCRGRRRLAAETPDAFAALRAWAGAQGITHVLPLTERSCVLCNAERDAWTAAGIVVGCAPQEVLQRAFDKAATLEYARGCGMAVPETCVPQSLRDAHAAVRALGLPCVVKPRFSNAWNGTGFLPDRGVAYVASLDDLDSAILARRQGSHWPLLQRMVPGRGIGVFALCDHGTPVAWFAHERLRDVRPSGSGSSLRRSVRLSAALREAVERLLRDMRWHGPVMVELRDDGVHPPTLLEVNGRFWGSLELAVRAGADFPAWWLSLLSGEPLPPVREYAADVTLRWMWGDVKRFFSIMRGAPRGFPGPYPARRAGVRELIGRQPPGTRSETWLREDPWPAVGEWVQGLQEVVRLATQRNRRNGAERERTRSFVPAPRRHDVEIGATRGSADWPSVTVLLPCRNERAHIGPCLESVLRTSYPHDRLEILVLDGQSDDGTREVAEQYARRHPVVRVLENPGRIVPTGLNLGIRAARGEVIVRMDAHVTYPAAYIPALVAALRETGAENVGGVIVTLPADQRAVSRAIAVALAHPFGVGNSYFRIGATHRRWVDTVAFGCFRKDLFTRVGLFDEELVRNQDDEFNFRLRRHGGRILLEPGVVAYYYARATRREVARMFYQYGYYKPAVARKVGRVMTLRQLAPPLFVLALAVTTLAGLWVTPARLAFGITAGSYAMAVVATAARAVRTHGWRCAAALMTVFPVIHVSYGFGFWAGLLAPWLAPRRRPTDPSAVPLSRWTSREHSAHATQR